MNGQRLYSVIFFLGCLLYAGLVKAAEQVGTMPVPTLQGVTITASVTYDAATQLYTYSYTVHNGASSSGSIFSVYLDMVSDGINSFPPNIGASLTFKRGLLPPDTFDDKVKSFASVFKLPPSGFLVPFGALAPSGWSSGLTADGYAAFDAVNSPNMQPGVTLSGFQVISPGTPTIREMVVIPDWQPVFDHEADTSEEQAAVKTRNNIRLHIQTLAPAGSNFLIWGDFDNVLAQMVQLGWITDTSLMQQLQGQLDAANAAAVQEYDGTKAKVILQSLLATLAAAPTTAMNAAARDLITLDVQALIRHIPNTHLPVRSK